MMTLLIFIGRWKLLGDLRQRLENCTGRRKFAVSVTFIPARYYSIRDKVSNRKFKIHCAQEACAVGLFAAMDKEDAIITAYRW